MKKNKIIIGMSGGVDSSISAKILKDKGFDVLGVFLRLGFDQEEDENFARKICEQLEIKFYPVNIAGEFKKEIINYFIDSYKKGITPNPCIKCNKFIKFDKFLKLASNLGYDYIATGHYAIIKKKGTIYSLHKGVDKTKDQSYFLYTLGQKELSRVIFPLGNLFKKDMKVLAKKYGLNYKKSESQDICFIQKDHNEFLKENLTLKKGPIKNLFGEILGEHQGLPLYTIGQRRGVELGGIGPLYVVKCDYKNNILYVSDDGNNKNLYRDKFEVKKVSWIISDKEKIIKCDTVIRYGGKPIKSKIIKGLENVYTVELERKNRAITPGQSAVFYEGDEVLGGGIIK
ncbi:tRNA 2-thiouridine(34) synthase MnmA [bacterium]|nr:tRNA 2-thiouridine(34) synthase MnmA [bacterium]